MKKNICKRKGCDRKIGTTSDYCCIWCQRKEEGHKGHTRHCNKRNQKLTKEEK